jgi:hypothetical protein
MATKKADNVVSIKQLRLRTVDVPLWGTSALVMHNWSHKSRAQMLNKQMMVATTGKEAKDPQLDFEESIYAGPDGLPAFPSVAFKNAAVDAAIAMDLKKTNLRQAFHVEGDMVPILGSAPEPREDMVRVGMGTADIRFRAQFTTWGTVLPVTLNESMLSLDQLVNLFNAAGFGIGIGEWRPQRDGQFGRFRVASETESKQLNEWLAARKKQRKAA